MKQDKIIPITKKMKQTDCINCENTSCLFKSSSSLKWIKKFSYKSGQHIFLEDMPVKGLYIVQKGTVNEFYLDKNDKKIITHTASNGEIFGHIDYSSVKHLRSAITIENTQICFFDKIFLYEVCLNNSELSLNLMNFFLDNLRETDKKLMILTDKEQNG